MASCPTSNSPTSTAIAATIKYGFVIFLNPDSISIAQVESIIRSRLIYDQFFCATEWGLSEIFTDYLDFRIDPTWHEFEGVEYTNELAAAPDSLSRFITILSQILPKNLVALPKKESLTLR